jgi:hypothetical protein
MEPVRTRSGRVSKPPDRYIPTEEVTDDYAREDHDEDEYDISDSDDDFEETDEEETDDDSDGDENGNLKGFVVEDESEEEA